MYYIGLDLGQSSDPTAMCIDQRVSVATGERDVNGVLIRDKNGDPLRVGKHHIRHLQRFQLGTSYPEIVDQVKRMVMDDRIRDNYIVLADATGVGRPVVDMMREKRIRVIPITITAGSNSVYDGQGGYHVPKRDLIICTQVLLQQKHVLFAEKLPEVRALTNELLNFQMKVTKSANDVYNAREGEHDDLVLSLAMAVWYSHNYGIAEQKEPKANPWAQLNYV